MSFVRFEFKKNSIDLLLREPIGTVYVETVADTKQANKQVF